MQGAREVVRSRERGAAIVEGALTLLLVMTTVLGTMEFGRFVWVRSMLQYGVQEGSRYASVRSGSTKAPATSADIAGITKDACIGLDRAGINVTVTWNPQNTTNSDVNVTATYTFWPVTSLILRREYALTETSVRRITN